MVDSKKLPWNTPAEIDTPKSWQAFETYRDMGIGRSLALVAQKLGKSETLIQRWSAKGQWKQRVRDYDAHFSKLRSRDTEKTLLNEHRRQLRAFQRSHRSMGKRGVHACSNAVLTVSDYLKNIDPKSLTMNEVCRLIDAISKAQVIFSETWGASIQFKFEEKQ